MPTWSKKQWKPKGLPLKICVKNLLKNQNRKNATNIVRLRKGKISIVKNPTLSQNSRILAAWLIGLKPYFQRAPFKFKTNQPGSRDSGVLRESVKEGGGEGGKSPCMWLKVFVFVFACTLKGLIRPLAL